jgi:diguanylate cyclase (GGDEF)-like protein
VAAATLGGLAFVAILGLILHGTADSTRTSVHFVQHSIAQPLAHLDASLQANLAGEALLHQAAATVGEERNTLLSASIGAFEEATAAWSSYSSHPLGLDGEAELAARYERHYAATKSMSAEVLVPIVQSTEPGVIPAEQIVAAQRNQADLAALIDLYEARREVALRQLDRHTARTLDLLEVAAPVAMGLVLLCGALGLRTARRVVIDRRGRSEQAAFSEFEARLARALEFAKDDEAAFAVAARAASETLPDASVSVLLADARDALTAGVGVPRCGVDRVDACAAMATGSPRQFVDSGALDACPALASAEPGCSVTCMPVSVAGGSAALLQLAAPVGAPPEQSPGPQAIVRLVGDRVTMLRAFARSQMEASSDPLTGLLNRRSLEDAFNRLPVDEPYVVVFADLDHFKLLNDLHGHEAGDAALRAFGHLLAESVRPGDLTCRWGGEEFIVILPGCDEGQALDAMQRLRTELVQALANGSHPAVTFSCGVAEGRPGETMDAAIARADDALHSAKEGGRDQSVAWSTIAGPTARV